MAVPRRPQKVGDVVIDRSFHVWTQHGDKWKCVICGGVTKHPSINGNVERYELLTDEERLMSPFIEVVK